MDGIELAARFSYITNSLRFCGPKEASQLFLEYLARKNGPDKVSNALKKFEGLFPYLDSIARKNNLHFLDHSVVEAYWIGNKMLDSFTNEDMKEIIRKLMKRGLPSSYGERLIENMPHGLLPHHNFNVFYVGVGMTTGNVATTTQNMDNCRISYGEVIEAMASNLIVKTDVVIRNPKIAIRKGEVKTIVYLPEMLPSVSKGDIVAIHWGFACYILSKEQKEYLENYTIKIIEKVNSVN
ncbi:hypothetical protein J4401_06670 [Candidatus Woesearchaeota archaeon]|nr:hypothetical protein [Candidatus Woesearchaeota archaeon]